MRFFNWNIPIPPMASLGLSLPTTASSLSSQQPQTPTTISHGISDAIHGTDPHTEATQSHSADAVGSHSHGTNDSTKSHTSTSEHGTFRRIKRVSKTPPAKQSSESAQSASDVQRVRANTDFSSHVPIQKAAESEATVGSYSASSSAPKSHASRVKIFEDVLDQPVIDIDRLRELSTLGIPDKPSSLRATYWKILLNYLPLEPSRWGETHAENRQLYKQFTQDFILDPSILHQRMAQSSLDMQGDGASPFCRVDSSSHPLTEDLGSDWSRYFTDRKILSEIDKDVRRTLPQFHFFNQLRSNTGQVNLDTASSDYNIYSSLIGVKRILFIFAKLNPGVQYVQGMNEILAPILYIMCMDVPPEYLEDAEADAFFCFTNIMGEVRDNFLRDLDNSTVGIGSRMELLRAILSTKDQEVSAHLEEIGMIPQYYSLRWLTLLLCQDFHLPEIIRLWDTLLADERRFDLLVYVCCAMMILVRDEILQSDFSNCLTMLQVCNTLAV
eukprot:TRINITY_DN6496_c0_g1_i1.p1 TRINITY_DN6496_c0_g1~~TRINITY_DN6496_c0_g1_i1.p1  ORF type:complete len:498 (+),score=73.92 TRINITY_DN6496_c0_g1_i1:76-1569(+)